MTGHNSRMTDEGDGNHDKILVERWLSCKNFIKAIKAVECLLSVAKIYEHFECHTLADPLFVNET